MPTADPSRLADPASGAAQGVAPLSDDAASRGDPSPRQRWLAVLARASLAELEDAWSGVDDVSAMTVLRPAEIGLVMARARAGGTGRRFNLGEITVTRCAVQSAGGTIGHGHVLGRDKQRAELVARFDALLQEPAWQDRLLSTVVAPLADRQGEARTARGRKAAATRVEFFTMVRGDA